MKILDIKTTARKNKILKETLAIGSMEYELYALKRIEELEVEVQKLNNKIEKLKKNQCKCDTSNDKQKKDK